MSNPEMGIIKCPKCKKYFTVPIGVRSMFWSKNKERQKQAQRLVKMWTEGFRKCPYCKEIISVKECKDNQVDIGYDEVVKKQGELEVGELLDKNRKEYTRKK